MKHYKLNTGLIPLLIFAILVGINTSTIPMHGDDILYQYYYPEIPIKNVPHGVVLEHRIESIKDISESIHNHYYNMNGRSPVHFAVQLFCSILGKKWFGFISIIGIFLFGYLVWILSFPATNNRSQWPILLPTLLFLLLYIEPTVWLSIADSFNYLWPPVLCLTFWLFISKEKDYHPKMSLLFILCVLSFIAGWSHEGLVIPLSIACAIYFVRNFKQLAYYKILMLFFWSIGAALLVFAPSNFNRAGNIGWSAEALLNIFKFMRLFWVMGIVVLWLFFKSKTLGAIFFKDNIDILIGISASIFLFSLIPSPPIRVAFGIDLFSVVLLCRVVSCMTIHYSFKHINYITNVIAILGVALSLLYQKRANEQMNDLISQLNYSEDQDFYIVKRLDCPMLFSKYISHYFNKYAYWNNLVYTWQYRKNSDLIVIEGNEGLNSLPGNTDWQFCSDYWFSKEPFTKECKIIYHIDYTSNIRYRIIWCAKKILRKEINVQKECQISLLNESLKEGRNYYLIKPYLPQHWKVDGVYVKEFNE